MGKKKFHSSRNPIVTCDVDSNKIMEYDASAYGKKRTNAMFFMGYKNDKKIRPICIKLPKMDGYVSIFRKTKYLCWDIKKNELLEKYDESEQHDRKSI